MFRPAEKALLALTAYHCILVPPGNSIFQVIKQNKAMECAWSWTKLCKVPTTEHFLCLIVSVSYMWGWHYIPLWLKGFIACSTMAYFKYIQAPARNAKLSCKHVAEDFCTLRTSIRTSVVPANGKPKWNKWARVGLRLLSDAQGVNHTLLHTDEWEFSIDVGERKPGKQDGKHWFTLQTSGPHKTHSYSRRHCEYDDSS